MTPEEREKLLLLHPVVPCECIHDCRPRVLRFFDFVQVHEDGCWLWSGGKAGAGYGYFYRGPKRGTQTYAHIWSHEHFVGVIRHGLHVDHLCRVISCVNPDHLEAVTPLENSIRSGNANVLRKFWTHCQNGHEFTKANTITRGSKRRCRSCFNTQRREYGRNYMRAKRASARSAAAK